MHTNAISPLPEESAKIADAEKERRKRFRGLIPGRNGPRAHHLLLATGIKW